MRPEVVREQGNRSNYMLRAGLSVLDRGLSPLDKLLARISRRRGARTVVDRPLFVFGLERSGTTLLYSVLANHPDLYWFSRLDSVLYSNPCLSSLARQTASPLSTRRAYIALPGTISRSRGLLPPSECLPYWKQVFKWGNEEEYLIEDDRFTEEEVDEDTKRFLHDDLSTRLLWMRKNRLLSKQSGFCLRIRFLNAVFPDALFLHIIRDPFANYLSLVRAKEASHEAFWGIKIPGWRDLLSADKRFQAAIQIQTTLQILEQDIRKGSILDRYLRVKYESLVTVPEQTVTRILQFCDLSWTDRIKCALDGVRRDHQAHRWQGDIPREISDVLHTVAESYGYS